MMVALMDSYGTVDAATSYELTELGVPMAGFATMHLILAPVEVCTRG